jgi:hypothetical protein
MIFLDARRTNELSSTPSIRNYRHVRLAYQPPANSTFLSEQTSHQQPASSTFLSEQISTSHQQPAKRTGRIGCFGFIKFIDVVMYLNTHYVWMHNNIYASRKPKTICNLEQRKYLLVGQGPAPILHFP